MKQCTKCEVEKQEEEFPFKDKANNKRNSICKECHRAYKLKHYYANKQQYYDRNQKQEDKIKLYVREYRLTNPCVNCGESEVSCLDFHHTDPTQKDGEVNEFIKYGSLTKVQNEIAKCVVLCANCHRKYHAGLNIRVVA